MRTNRFYGRRARDIWPLLYALVFSSGCTHQLYKGELDGIDHQGKSQTYRIYWTKTYPLFGQSRMSPVFLDVGCGRTEFTKRNGSYSLELPDAQYALAQVSNGKDASPSRLLCGEIYTETPLEELSTGEIQLMIYCRPKTAQYSLYPSSFPMSRYAPYPIWINSTSHGSLSNQPPTPEPLSCL